MLGFNHNYYLTPLYKNYSIYSRLSKFCTPFDIYVGIPSAECLRYYFVQGIIQEFEIGMLLEIVGGCCERSEQKFFHTPPTEGVFCL
jgi:hypothetical protein